MSIVKLNDVRLFFPALFEPEEFKGKKNYRAIFAVEPGSANDKAIHAAVLEVATVKWGKKAQARIDEFGPVKQQFPYRDGNKVDYDGAEGLWVLTANRKEDQGRPLVLDRNKSPLQPKDGKPYSGCYVNASVEIWAQDGENSGIRCALRGVQFFRDGDAFSGGSKVSDDEFDELEEGADADDLV